MAAEMRRSLCSVPMVNADRNSRIYENVLIVDQLFCAAELRFGIGNRQQNRSHQPDADRRTTRKRDRRLPS